MLQYSFKIGKKGKKRKYIDFPENSQIIAEVAVKVYHPVSLVSVFAAVTVYSSGKALL